MICDALLSEWVAVLLHMDGSLKSSVLYLYLRRTPNGKHNGQNVALGISDDNDDLSSTTINLELKEGDTVHVQSNNGNYQENTDNSFQGYLLRLQ